MAYPAPFYAALHRGSPGDLQHYEHVCRGATTVLELGCGYGRMVARLAAAGHSVTGVELHPGLLKLAHTTVDRLPLEQRRNVELLAGDMRTLSLGRRFDRVLIPFGGLYCMLDDDAVAAALATAADHLNPGGRLAFDVYAADAFHHESDPTDVPDDAHTPLCRVSVEGVDYEVLEQSVWNKPAQRIDASYLYIDETGRTVEGVIEQRYLLRPQIEAALTRAGFVVETFDQGFAPRKRPATADEEDDHDAPLVVVARLALDR